MPTPFTHLHISQRLLNDPALSGAARQFINANQAAFLLGGIVADARPIGVERADTHFYHYTRPMPDHPWREMFRQHPGLEKPHSDDHHIFLAGYVAHLAVDEYWSRFMLKPYFAEGEWGGDIRWRFFILHLVLIHMDERDLKQLNGDVLSTLQQSDPNDWLPFLTDDAIRDWRDFIVEQLDSGSQTLDVLGVRVGKKPEELRKLLDDDGYMDEQVWQPIQRDVLARIEAGQYEFARGQMDLYLRKTAS